MPFIHEQLPKAIHFAGRQALLLADSEFDVDWLVRDDVDVTQAEEIGRALRGERPRTGYVHPDERARKEQAIAAVQTAYLAHRGPRPRALAQADIDVIVREGLAHGLLINLELVHAVTDGRGSPNAVYPKLADAMGRLAPRRPIADDVDPALRSLWTQLREAALADATEALAPERAALAAEQAALATEREQDARAAAERERQQQRLEAELASARDRIDSLVNVEKGLGQELARVAAERDALQGQLTDTTAALTALQLEHAAQREAHERALGTERELTAAERDAAASARELATAKLRDVNERLAALRRDADATLAELQEARQANVQLREALATAQHEAADALAEAQAAAAASMAHATERTTLQQRIDEALAEGAIAQRALATLEGEHRAVVRERDRLDRLLVRLRPTPKKR